MKKSKTSRGFNVTEFTDCYDAKCSIKNSSLATEDAIWFGINKAQPMIMASKAKKLGLKTNENTGWIPYPIPEEVLISTHMHLTDKMVEDILPSLIEFCITGDIHGQSSKAEKLDFFDTLLEK